MNTLKKYWPTILALSAPLAPLVEPSIRSFIAQNPIAFAVVAGLATALTHISPSPSQAQTIDTLKTVLSQVTPATPSTPTTVPPAK
jgi:hypothetical protein